MAEQMMPDGHPSFGKWAGQAPTGVQMAAMKNADRIVRTMPEIKTMPGSADQPGPADVVKTQLQGAPRKG